MALYWPTISEVIAAGGSYLFDRGTGHIPRYHQGDDIHIPTGTTIYASGTGIITALPNTGNTSGFGRYAQVQYGNVQVRTAHMSSFAAGLHVGQQVTVSTVLGLSGGAYHADGAGDSTGSHCHCEVHVNGALADPKLWLMSRSTISGGGKPVPVTPTIAVPSEGDTMRTVKSLETGAVYNLGELTSQLLDTLEQGSMSAHIWNGTTGAAEPVVVNQSWIDTEIGQIEKRRAQFAVAFQQITSPK